MDAQSAEEPANGPSLPADLGHAGYQESVLHSLATTFRFDAPLENFGLEIDFSSSRYSYKVPRSHLSKLSEQSSARATGPQEYGTASKLISAAVRAFRRRRSRCPAAACRPLALRTLHAPDA